MSVWPFFRAYFTLQIINKSKSKSSNKNDYESLLIASIEQEFEHNLSQQIYVSDECWSIISAAKNATIQLIRKANMLEKLIQPISYVKLY